MRSRCVQKVIHLVVDTGAAPMSSRKGSDCARSGVTTSRLNRTTFTIALVFLGNAILTGESPADVVMSCRKRASSSYCLQDVDFCVAHTAGSTIDKIRICQSTVHFQYLALMEYAAYLRIVPFAAQNHAANTPVLHGASRMSISV